jgi:magnesium-protoporphyrin O-methyltransferase
MASPARVPRAPTSEEQLQAVTVGPLKRLEEGQVACDCPADSRIAGYFDRRSRKRQEAGQRYEPGAVSKALRGALMAEGPAGRTVLELGCGPGALLVGLLSAGADRASGVDLSPEAVEEARRRAEEAGVADRADFTVADGAHAVLAPHDWVVLDKVMCCYPDVDALLGNSIPAARHLYAFAVPASYGWRGAIARAALSLEALVLAILRRPCPAYVHDVRMIEARLTEGGLRPVTRRTCSFWHLAVFAR